jgi:hypothetical protein
MSVIVIGRFPVSDVARGLAALKENGALLEEITVDAKKQGAIHHCFAAGEGELVVIDEWDTAEHFQTFFGGNPKVEKITTAVGVTGPPTMEVLEKGEALGTF